MSVGPSQARYSELSVGARKRGQWKRGVHGTRDLPAHKHMTDTFLLYFLRCKGVRFCFLFHVGFDGGSAPARAHGRLHGCTAQLPAMAVPRAWMESSGEAEAALLLEGKGALLLSGEGKLPA